MPSDKVSKADQRMSREYPSVGTMLGHMKNTKLGTVIPRSECLNLGATYIPLEYDDG